MQRVGGQQVEVAVAEARVELDGQLLALGDLERAEHEIVVEGLVGQAYSSLALRPLLHRAERLRGLAARRLAHGEPGAIRDDALEADVARGPGALDRGDEVADGLVERVVAHDQVLGEGLQPQDRGERARQACPQLGVAQALSSLIAVVNEQHAAVRVAEHPVGERVGADRGARRQHGLDGRRAVEESRDLLEGPPKEDRGRRVPAVHLALAALAEEALVADCRERAAGTHKGVAVLVQDRDAGEIEVHPALRTSRSDASARRPRLPC